MDKKAKEAKNIAAKTKGKIIYLPHEGVIAENKKGISTPFKFGMNIQDCLAFTYVFEDEEPENSYSRPLYMFFDETFMVCTTKVDKTSISIIKCSDSFIFEGYEIIGMKLDVFLQLNLIHFDYFDEDNYLPGSGDGTNFRYYKVYYNIEHKLAIFVWREKIRFVTLCNSFFTERLYEDPAYLERYHIRKL